VNTLRCLVAVLKSVHRLEKGQMLVLAAGAMVAILGLAAFSIDIGFLIHERQNVQNATDAAALAGAQQLPDNASSGEALARQYATTNDSNLDSSNTDVSFRCLIGAVNGSPRLSDIPAACDPKGDASWTVKGDLAVSPCVPANGDKCNVIVVSASTKVNFFLAPVLGIKTGSTGNITSAACRGACGGPPTSPVDLITIIDRTSSMSSSDVTNARNAANAILRLYNPALQWVGLGLLGSSSTSSSCSGSPTVHVTAASSPTTNWVPIELTGTGAGAPINEAYVNPDGTLNTNSHLVKAISCFNTSSTGTDLASPVAAAASYLRTHGRSGAKKGIILVTDGSPNGSTCLAAYNEAQGAKTGSPSIEIFTIGFGLSDSDKCPDTSGSYKGKSVVQLLADMATTSTNNGCNDAENTDGDHFFCLPKTSQLASIFEMAAQQLAPGSHLVNLP
jgi:Flp pilus assembly protein TadG